MSESIATIRSQLWDKMRNPEYRKDFVAAHLSTNIAAQIQTLREARGWTQRELAKRTDMSPARISVMEDPSYEKFTLTTLKRLAAAFDVALVARFQPFSELVDWVVDLTPEKLAVPSFDSDSLEKVTASIATEKVQPILSSGFGLGSTSIRHSRQSEPQRGDYQSVLGMKPLASADQLWTSPSKASANEAALH